MKLATLDNGKLDGRLVVVSRDLTRMLDAEQVAPTLQAALDQWDTAAPRLQQIAEGLSDQQVGEPFPVEKALSPLPRAYQWCDGSTYAAHFDRMKKWEKKEVDARYFDEVFAYQGGSDDFLAPTESIPAASEDWGVDLEAEIAVVTTGLKAGSDRREAGAAIRLIMLCNDVSLRNLIPDELSKGFGFIQSKSASSFAPVAVTPDELGDDWRDYRLHGPVVSHINGEKFGEPDAGDMIHGFDRVVFHVAKTRAIGPGSIFGGGTVADPDTSKGTSCITERRIIEMLETGESKTEYLKFGDTVRIEMFHRDGASIFGAINQSVTEM